ncbi:MOSC domain-containing protein YiiM [Paenibacillus eucommiae]|uniref:MOSC domain-containing protein YiiM n=1 Tax=Paenibacillus eucommiae TaxID=1355755 RepID=A0ABS4IZD0_9BACL|nr:MOSC domain-containing protein YiiM [Paenibacillus eucommiae]
MKVTSINVGKPQVLIVDGKELITGIMKFPSDAPLFLSSIQLEGDGQADLAVHGGVDKALCVYCQEHYSHWEQVLGEKLEYGAFGENVTVLGLLESDVCIGDRYELGAALVEVTQPRQPCFKLAKRYGRVDLPLMVQKTGFTGFYFRVIREGIIPVQPDVRLVSRHPGGVTVQLANQLKYHDVRNIEGIKRILAVEELSASWRASFSKRLIELEEANV